MAIKCDRGKRKIAERPDVTRNLRALCARSGSISEICRKIGVNRQQFNKYLNGTHQPTVRTAGRIAAFFKIEAQALYLPHRRFMAEVVEKSKYWKLPDELLAYTSAMEPTLKQSFQTLRSYCGNYYLYYRSPSWPGGVIRSFMSIYQVGSMTYAKSIDRLFWRDKTPSGRSVQKCQSIVLIEGDRLYVIDRNRNQRGDLSMLILLPSNRSQINLIYGLQVSVTGSGARMPFASRAVLKRLDGNVSIRAALKECGVFAETNSSIDPAITADTLNAIASKDNALVGLAY